MIVGLFPALASAGGVQTAGRQTAAALSSIAKERGCACAFLSLNDAKGDREATCGSLRFPFRGFGRNKPQFVLAALRLARTDPSVIFAAHPNLAPIAAAMKLLARKAQVIIGTHGIEVWQPLPALRGKALHRADLVIAPSFDTVRKLLDVQGLSEANVRRLPWPVDSEILELAESRETFPRPDGFPDGRVVLTVGRWAANERYKGADILIQAAAELAGEFSDLNLVLVGSGDDLPRLKQLALESGAQRHIQFLTNLSRAELAFCYDSAEIFALPSTGEGFGLVFLEAMAFRKPTIGTALGGIPDIVEDGVTGVLVDPKNPSSLFGALRALLSNNDLRLRMGHRAGEVVRERYDFQTFKNNLASLLRAANAE
ncbi:MAG: glycosyltransferase family 4 protein [Candidatus Acidiferrales bacterium]